jgi:CRISPR system Cascade subunit CasE
MFYTHIVLSSSHPALKRDLGNVYQQHRRIESLFPEHKRSEASALFRWDQLSIIIQSAIEPRFDLLPKHYTSDIQTKIIDLAEVLRPGQWLQFRLLADTSSIERQTRRRVARDIETLPKWLAKRLESSAQIDKNLEIHQKSQITVHRLEQEWKLRPVSFTGYLRVVEPEQLALAIAQGFGRSRAYGCGLMQVVPAMRA